MPYVLRLMLFVVRSPRGDRKRAVQLLRGYQTHQTVRESHASERYAAVCAASDGIRHSAAAADYELHLVRREISLVYRIRKLLARKKRAAYVRKYDIAAHCREQLFALFVCGASVVLSVRYLAHADRAIPAQPFKIFVYAVIDIPFLSYFVY